MKAELEKAIAILRDGKLLLYPTDTVWGIGCDATDPEAVQKVYELKNRPGEKALICLVSDMEMLKKHVSEVPDAVHKILKDSPRPTTIIYDRPIHIARNLIAPDRTLAIRICQDKFCRELIEGFGKPIVSTSANLTGKPTPKSFAQIDDELVKGVDYVVNLHRKAENVMPSRIIKLANDGQITIIRD